MSRSLKLIFNVSSRSDHTNSPHCFLRLTFVTAPTGLYLKFVWTPHRPPSCSVTWPKDWWAWRHSQEQGWAPLDTPACVTALHRTPWCRLPACGWCCWWPLRLSCWWPCSQLPSICGADRPWPNSWGIYQVWLKTFNDTLIITVILDYIMGMAVKNVISSKEGLQFYSVVLNFVLCMFCLFCCMN